MFEAIPRTRVLWEGMTTSSLINWNWSMSCFFVSIPTGCWNAEWCTHCVPRARKPQIWGLGWYFYGGVSHPGEMVKYSRSSKSPTNWIIPNQLGKTDKEKLCTSILIMFTPCKRVNKTTISHQWLSCSDLSSASSCESLLLRSLIPLWLQARSRREQTLRLEIQAPRRTGRSGRSWMLLVHNPQWVSYSN
jgi:hypothetical protein